MTRTLTIAAIGLFVTTILAHPAQAQMKWTDQGFVNVNVGVLAGSHSLNTDTTLEISGEPASIRTTQDVGGGFLFDVSGGYKVWRNLAVGLGYSHSGSKEDLAIAADIPDPLFTDQFRHVTTSARGAGHSENAIHLTGTWMVPYTDKIDIGVQFGPTIWIVSQDLPSDFSITEPGPTVNAVSLSDESNTTVGIHLGVDVTYMWDKLYGYNYGFGGNIGYTWGSVDLPGSNLTVGGFKIAGGLRVRF